MDFSPLRFEPELTAKRPSFLFHAELPNSPRVTSRDRGIDTSGAVAGVYDEDDPMNLICDVVGGEGEAVSLAIDGIFTAIYLH